jgi:hypothetical protein
MAECFCKDSIIPFCSWAPTMQHECRANAFIQFTQGAASLVAKTVEALPLNNTGYGRGLNTRVHGPRNY